MSIPPNLTHLRNADILGNKAFSKILMSTALLHTKQGRTEPVLIKDAIAGAQEFRWGWNGEV